MEKRLEHIVPFNDFWYTNCLMQNILSLISFYNIDVSDFIKNDLMLYQVDGDSLNSLNVVLKSQMFLPQYLSNYGLRYSELGWRSNPELFLIDSINKGIPTICSIDCFYEPQRNDAYHLKHLAHTILVYGYDLDERYFIILEHDYVNSPLLKERHILFSDLIECMNGYAKFRANDSMIQLIPLTVFVEKDIQCGNELITIKKFWNIMRETIDFIDYSACDKVISLLSSYVNCKKVMLYQMGEKNCILQNTGIKNAGILMALIAKYRHTKLLKNETRIYCSELIRNIFLSEIGEC